MGNTSCGIADCTDPRLHLGDSYDIIEAQVEKGFAAKNVFLEAEGVSASFLEEPCSEAAGRASSAAGGSTKSGRRGGAEGVAESDVGQEELDGMIEDFKQLVTLTMSRYHALAAHPHADEDCLDKADATMRRLQQRLRRDGLKKGCSWHGDEADMWLSMLAGGQKKRFKGLREVVRQVQVETRIIKQWRRRSSSLSSQQPLHQQVKVDLDSWEGFDAFHIEGACQHPLTQVFMSIWSSRSLDLCSRATDDGVLKFLRAVEGAYLDNPYHNRIHAADVTHAAYHFWSQLSAQPHMEGYFGEVDLLALLVAAAVHDVGHPGRTNEFLVKTQNPLALQYSDRSVLENHHAATAFMLLKESGVPLLDHRLVSPPQDAIKARIVDMILATDMTHHRRVLEQMTTEVKVQATTQDINKLVLEQHILHMADVAHALRPAAQHRAWSDAVRMEFFAQGDEEKSMGHQPGPLFDRSKSPTLPKGQMGFLNFVVAPTWKPLEQILGPASKALDAHLWENMAMWEEMAKKEEEVAAAEQGQRSIMTPSRSRRSTVEF
mmetsp:Transcript_148436/g.476720  ORF Transcript_148436/g.476720 Transcript_148436/m.476720 type:complete len:546 (-) Transcript_148436:45-1682(-)